jgi:hypothetical protein
MLSGRNLSWRVIGGIHVTLGVDARDHGSFAGSLSLFSIAADLAQTARRNGLNKSAVAVRSAQN